MIITIKSYKLSKEPKKGDKFKGGKADGYVIKNITTYKKFFGTTTTLFIEHPDTKLRRRVSYYVDTMKISDFKRAFFTTKKGTYPMDWDDSYL